VRPSPPGHADGAGTSIRGKGPPHPVAPTPFVRREPCVDFGDIGTADIYSCCGENPGQLSIIVSLATFSAERSASPSRHRKTAISPYDCRPTM